MTGVLLVGCLLVFWGTLYIATRWSDTSRVLTVLTQPEPDDECVICGAIGQPWAAEFGDIPVCADVAACTDRQERCLAADGKLDDQ